MKQSASSTVIESIMTPTINVILTLLIVATQLDRVNNLEQFEEDAQSHNKNFTVLQANNVHYQQQQQQQQQLHNLQQQQQYYQQQQHSGNRQSVAPGVMTSAKQTPKPNYIETSKQITAILDRFMQLGYDKRVRPNYGGPPVEVNVTMRILSISSVSEVMMDFTADFYFRQTWHDPRLAFTKINDIKTLYVGAEVSKKIWLPDTFFGNEKMAYFHEATTPNVFLRIDHSGEVYRSIRLTVTSSCPMNLQYFPMDRQRCTIEAESYGYNVKDIIYRWSRENTSVERDEQISLPQFDIVRTVQKYRLEELSSGTYSRLIAELHFARRMGYYLIQIYIPSSLIVVISWVSFWLHRNASPARVQLGVTTVLTMTTLMSSTNAALPKISYIKSIDIFLGTCFIMVFAALLEYATVGYLGKRIAMRKAQLQHAQSQAQARTFAQLQAQGAQGDPIPLLSSSSFLVPGTTNPATMMNVIGGGGGGVKSPASNSVIGGSFLPAGRKKKSKQFEGDASNTPEPPARSSSNISQNQLHPPPFYHQAHQESHCHHHNHASSLDHANQNLHDNEDDEGSDECQHCNQQQRAIDEQNIQAASLTPTIPVEYRQLTGGGGGGGSRNRGSKVSDCRCSLMSTCQHLPTSQQVCCCTTTCHRNHYHGNSKTTSGTCHEHSNTLQRHHHHANSCCKKFSLHHHHVHKNQHHSSNDDSCCNDHHNIRPAHNHNHHHHHHQYQASLPNLHDPDELNHFNNQQMCSSINIDNNNNSTNQSPMLLRVPNLATNSHCIGDPFATQYSTGSQRAGAALAATAAAATLVNLHRKNKGLPPSTNPNFAPFNWTFNVGEKRNVESIFGVRPSDIDKYSRVVFPVCFLCFQLMYWIIYLHISALVETETKSVN